MTGGKIVGFVACAAVVLSSGCTTLANSDSAGGRNAEAADANFKLGASYLQSGQFDQALYKLRRSLHYDPDRADTYNALGVLFEQLQNAREAEKNFKLAIDKDPKYDLARLNYGRLLCHTARTENGEQQFLSVIENGTFEALEVPYTGAGVCAKARNDWTAAETYFKKALEINPLSSATVLELAALNLNNKNFLAAQQYIQQYHSQMGFTIPSLQMAVEIEAALGNEPSSERYRQLLENRSNT